MSSGGQPIFMRNPCKSSMIINVEHFPSDTKDFLISKQSAIKIWESQIIADRHTQRLLHPTAREERPARYKSFL